MSSHWDLRSDGEIFSREYLLGSNRDIAEEYLWPVPVFKRHRQTTGVTVNEITIKPGDVLEFCGESYEEYLLVIAVLPNPASTGNVTSVTHSNRLLTYSSNAETYRVFDADRFIDSPRENSIEHPTGTYVIHSGAGSLVGIDDESPPDVTYPPKPRTTQDEGPRDRIKNDYPHISQSPSIRPSRAFAGDTNPIEELLQQIHQGDAEDILKQFPTSSIHGWVTSPPYFNQRDYNAENQIGLEESVEEYLEELLTVVNQLMRVTHESGIGWIVLDDSYHNGRLAGIPEKLHQELKTEGYEVLHHSPWVKPNPKPEPVENRFSHAHEYILAITHSSEQHYFNKHAVEDQTDVFNAAVGNTDTDHDAVFPIELPKRLIKTSIPEKVCAECNTPYRQTHGVTDIRDLPTERPQAKRALELAQKHNLSDEHLRAIRSVGLSHTGQAKRTQTGTGKNKSNVEKLAAEAEEKLGSYAREFTQAKKHPTGFEQDCDCDEAETTPGIVLDPFAGSGTTCLAAKQVHRRWTGIELNPDYVAAAESRIGIDVTEPDRLTPDDQQTLLNFE